ncbi:hypothetical protein JHK87_043697 [Glycine soja]|nr:hypothetical protein JHK87_043697 [Glycine soja]
MTSQAKPKQKIRRAPFRIAEQYSHRNIFQRKSKKNGCKNEFFGAGNIAAGDPPGSGTTLLPSGNMERPRRRRVPHYQLLLLWRRASLLSFPQLGYTQKTWKLSSGEPMHAESGYWRPKPDGTIEVVIAQSNGLVEVQKGTYSAEEKMIHLQSEIVGNASKVKEIRRCFQLVDGNLCYDVQMATNTITLQPHLKASLKKL